MPDSDPAVAGVAQALATLRGLSRRPGPGTGMADHGGHGRHDGHSERGDQEPCSATAPRPPGRRGGRGLFLLLDVLAATSEPLGVSEIAAAIGVDQPRASRLVQHAADRDLAERQADPHDARRARVALTDAGRDLIERSHAQQREAVSAALAEFSERERAELARLLGKLADAWPR